MEEGGGRRRHATPESVRIGKPTLSLILPWEGAWKAVRRSDKSSAHPECESMEMQRVQQVSTSCTNSLNYPGEDVRWRDQVCFREMIM